MSSKVSYIQGKVIEFLNINPKYKSPKGWIIGGECPWCGKSDKFGVKLNQQTGRYRNHISFNCFRGSCGEKGSEYKLLNQLGKGHLLKHGDFIGNQKQIQSKIALFEEKLPTLEVPTVSLPLGFKRNFNDPYLIDRGFEQWQFEQYCIGRTKLYSPLKDYVIFSITEDGENKGYVARSIKDSQWIKQHNDAVKQFNKTADKFNKKRSYPKYINEGGVDFAKLLFGIDEIDEQTVEVILVEGVTDKANVDKQLKLNQSPLTKCLCTFGKKISEEQILKLVSRGISKVTLLYDPDAIEESKKYSFDLEMFDFNVKVGYLSNKDPGELNYDELTDILSKTQTPNVFSIAKIQKRKLN